MPTSYDDAVAELYRSAHDAFVAERKRLAGELKAAGDKLAAARLSKLARPTLSAWAVNQLWWQAREPFERLFAAAARLRAGDQSGAGERRDALANLKSRAASLLVDAGHAVSEGTLRRVTTTLSALAASGGFEPDAPGALAADRDPPGFDAAALGGFGAAASAPAPPARAPAAREQPETPREPVEKAAAERARADAESAARDRAQVEREQRAERERLEREREEREREEREREERLLAEERRQEMERAARRAERERLQSSLPALRSDLERREREVERLRAEVARVEGLAQQARAAIDDAEERLAELTAAKE
jgi:hypothetical protein